MKDRIKKIIGWKPGVGLYVAGATLGLVLLLIPLIRLAFYAVPWYDDYNYGYFAYLPMRENPTFLTAVKGALECIHISRHAWQGTYSSIFFMVLMPGIWGEAYYFWGPLFLIGLLTCSVLLFVEQVLELCFHAKQLPAFGLGILSAALVLELIYTAREGFYWYNGGVHYLGMHSFLLLMLVAALRCCYAKKMSAKLCFALLAACLAFVVAGGNFVSALQGSLALGCMLVLGGYLKKKQIVFLLPAFLVYSIGFYCNVSAPGNDKRAENYVGWGMSPVKAILNSFLEGGKYAWKFTGFMTLAFLCLMLPLILYLVKRSQISFRLPGLVTLFSICFYATGFTPSLYSLGHEGLSRTLNAVKITWQLLLIFNVIYWCGWLVRKKDKLGREMFGIWYYFPVAVMVIISFGVSDNRVGSFSSYGAYYYIHTGYANNFYEEYLARLELLKGEEKVVSFEPYHWQPWMIYMGDLSTDPNAEANRALAKWYGKKEIYLQAEEE